MPFEIKGYNIQKMDLSEAFKVYLKNNNVATYKELAPPRRDQILFIHHVILALDDQIASQRIDVRSSPYPISVLFGALSMLCCDITANLGRFNRTSFLRACLNNAQAVTTTQTPSTKQYLECYQALNHFLKHLFIETNQDMRLKHHHALIQSIDRSIFLRLMRQSFECEETAYNEHINTMQETSSSTIKATECYKAKNPFREAILHSSSGNFHFLQEELHRLIIRQLADKGVANILMLDAKRAMQLALLNKISTTLAPIAENKISQNQKMAILMGCMHLIREQINQNEYSMPALYREDLTGIPYISKGSLIQNGLGAIIHAKTERIQNIEFYLSTAADFIYQMTVENEQIRSHHLFSDIPGFNLKSLLALAQKTIRSCRVNLLDDALLELKQSPPSPTFISSLTSDISAASAASTLLRSYSAVVAPQPQSAHKAKEEEEYLAEAKQPN